MLHPAHDDWGYASPKPGINILAALMPTQIFWRPFDRLIEYGLGYAPYLFPYFNHGMVLFAHLTLCAALYILLKTITRSKICSFAGTLFFCVNTGIIYTVTNSDTINQCWAMLVGAVSVFCFFKARIDDSNKFFPLWIIFAWLSTLWKEEGIAWCLAPVFLYMVYEYAESDTDLCSVLKRHYVFLAVGLLGMASYFAVRFALMGSISLGSEEGRHALTFSPALILRIVKNYCYIFAGAGTSIDTLALFLKPRKLPVLALTGIVSVIFLACVICGITCIFRRERKVFTVLLLLVICAMYISSPYTVMGKTAESQAYEMAFMLGLILGIVLKYSKPGKLMIAVCVLMYCSMFSVCCHKIFTMHEWTCEIRDFLAEHVSDFRNRPSNVYVYCIEDIPLEGYSVYKYPLGHGLHYGGALNSLWDWEATITREYVRSDVDVHFSPETLPEYDTVVTLTQSGKLKVLRN